MTTTPTTKTKAPGRDVPPAGSHVTLRMGRQELTVEPLGWRRAKAWREQALAALQQFGTIALKWDSIRLDSEEGVRDLMGRAEQLLIEAPDLIFELVIGHDTQFAANREHLEEHATTTQVARAFKEVLALEFPLEELRGLLRMVQSGPAAPTTSKS